jgi:hypothetical protein
MAVLPTGIGPVTGGYQIERSLRFNSADSAYLNRTPGSAGNRRTWTWSGWVKRSTLGTVQGIFDAYSGSSDFATVFFNTDNTIYFYSCYNSGSFIDYDFTTTAVFRDVGAWYHIVLVLNTVSATQADRFIVYVNGVRQAGTNPSGAFGLNEETYINSTVSHRLGSRTDGSYYSNGYMTEVNFINGQALTPSDFGETDSSTGVWKPKAYTGTYGTNGFYLKFADNSNTTAATLGKDSSGNGNNWTPNNFSVTAGAGNDSLVDSPTNYGTDTGVGGTVRGNYCTWNPLDKNSNGSLLNGNLDNSNGSANNAGVRSTFAFPSSDKWYAELRVNTTTSGSVALGFGFATSTADLAGSVDSANKYVIYGSSSGSIFSNTSTVTSSLGAFTAGDILQVAYDGATGKAWLGKNNTWYNSTGGTTGNPGAGTNQTFTLTGQMFIYSYYYAVSGSLNCGQRAFAYTAPSGFKALCTQNLPTPTIGATSTTQAGKYFNPILYTGDGTAPKSFTGVGFQPDLVWIKARSAAYYHHLTDAVRGANKSLYSNVTDAEVTSNAVSAFGSDGFTINNTDVNGSGVTYVAWNWKANGAGSSNTAGTITSTVSANTTAGFSVVTYTGNGTTGATFGHGLGVTPDMIIIKKRSTGTAGNWIVYHTSTGINQYLYLNSTAGAATSSPTWGVSSTLVTLQQSFNDYNTSTAPYVAYCFDAVAGYSAFGSYTGNGSADGPFVYLGFRPAYVMIKYSSGTADWIVLDKSRPGYNVIGGNLYPNSSLAEDTQTKLDLTSNGFKIRADGSNANVNVSSGTYIYAAFAESPFKYALAR